MPDSSTQNSRRSWQTSRSQALKDLTKTWPEEAFQFDIKIPNELRVGIYVNAPLEFGAAVADTYEEWIDGKLQKRPGQCAESGWRNDVNDSIPSAPEIDSRLCWRVTGS